MPLGHPESLEVLQVLLCLLYTSREGLQLECIGCANCIDACDDIMTRLDRPIGLIRYDSLSGLAGRRKRWARPRVYLYLVILALLAGTGAVLSLIHI